MWSYYLVIDAAWEALEQAWRTTFGVLVGWTANTAFEQLPERWSQQQNLCSIRIVTDANGEQCRLAGRSLRNNIAVKRIVTLLLPDLSPELTHWNRKQILWNRQLPFVPIKVLEGWWGLKVGNQVPCCSATNSKQPPPPLDYKPDRERGWVALSGGLKKNVVCFVCVVQLCSFQLALRCLWSIQANNGEQGISRETQDCHPASGSRSKHVDRHVAGEHKAFCGVWWGRPCPHVAQLGPSQDVWSLGSVDVWVESEAQQTSLKLPLLFAPGWLHLCLTISFIQIVCSCAAYLVRSIAISCFERGALMAKLWNMYTEVLDSEWERLKSEKQGLEQKSRKQQDQIERCA